VPEPPLILVTNDDRLRSPLVALCVSGINYGENIGGAGSLDGTAARHFTRLLARQVLDSGMPEGVSVLNLNVPLPRLEPIPVSLSRS
jgi:broad specificity polyphosphatase/5'/3'-nucleotidase SurE